MPCRKLNITDFFCFTETKKIIDHEVTDLCFPQAKINFDNETGLVYYNYRYYSPELARWLSRDPIEEDGGFNLYAMVGNGVVNKWDMLGYAFVKKKTRFESTKYSHAIISHPIVSMKIYRDKTCQAPNCIKLEFISVDMTAEIIIKTNPLNPADLAHEQTHVRHMKLYAYDRSVSYAKSIAGCYETSAQANCWANTASLSAEKNYWLASLYILIHLDLTQSLTSYQRSIYLKMERTFRKKYHMARKKFNDARKICERM